MRSSAPFRKGIDLRDNNGIYNYQGRAYPSVTKILEGSSNWMFVERAAIKAEIARLLDLSRLGERVTRSWTDETTGELCEVDVDPLDLLADGDHIAGSGARFLRACADRGTIVHDALELWGSGCRWKPSEIEDVVADIRNNHKGDALTCKNLDVYPYVHSLTGWLTSVQLTVLFAEIPVFSDTHGYAGRLDMIGEVNGVLYVLDLKSTGSMKRPYVAQTAAYRWADFGVEDPGIQVPLDLPGEVGVGIILCSPEKCGLRTVTEAEARPYYDRMFLPALTAWKAGATDEAVGGALPMPAARAEWVKV